MKREERFKHLLEVVIDTNFEDTLEELAKLLSSNSPFLQVITANPEIIIHALEDGDLYQAAVSPSTKMTADGIGVVWAAEEVLEKHTYKITGVDLMMALLRRCHEDHRRVFMFGAAPEVIDAAVERIHTEYPGVDLVGAINGFGPNRVEVKRQIIASKPDLILIALGSPAQDLFIHDLSQEITHGVAIGVGGSFDVLSGKIKRAPDFVQKLRLEWLYRVMKQPSRIRRLMSSHVPFVRMTMKAKRDS